MPTGYRADGTPANPTGKGGFQDRPWDRGQGMSGKAKLAWHRAAEALAEAQAAQAEAYLRVVQNAAQDGDMDKLALIKSEFNTFIKNVVDRVDGTPKQSVDLSSEDGSMTPKGLGAFYADIGNDD